MKKSRAFRWIKRTFVFCILAAGAAYGGLVWQANQTAGRKVVFETTEVKKGDVAQVVTATGELMPLTKVEVGSQISGIIQELFADFNSPVKAGQVIAKLDPSTYDANLLKAEGDLDNAKADLALAKINEQRAQMLRKESLNPQSEYDVALAELHKAGAAVKIAEGSYKKAKVDLDRCTIFSPIDGIVILRNVDVGQTVAASLSAPVLMLIAKDLSKMQIEANVVEADIGLVKDGQAVEFRVDAYPNEKFKGKVTQVRNAPKEEMNVVVYRTIIEVSNPELKLKPGMTATVAIIVASREDSLKLANAALRFKPPKGTHVVEIGPDETVGATGKESRSGSSKGKEKARSRKVYLLSEGGTDPGSVQPAALRLATVQCGISDGKDTEVLAGLSAGDLVVTGVEKAKASEKFAFNPFAFLDR